MLVSNGTRVALKANLPSPVSESPAEQAPNLDQTASSDTRAAQQQPDPEEEVLQATLEPEFKI